MKNYQTSLMEPIATIDFETTGLSPNKGDRATEVAAVIIRDGKIVSRYQSLMNAGVHVPEFITNYTGITNKMVRNAPPSAQVMKELCDFLDQSPLIAHNASFDERFFENECRLAGVFCANDFACSMLISRRLFPKASNHKLETLVNYLKIRKSGQFHRALSDAEMTAKLVLAINRKLSEDYGISYLTHDMLSEIQRTRYADIGKTLEAFGKKPPLKRSEIYTKAPPKEFIRSALKKKKRVGKVPLKSAPPPKPQPFVTEENEAEKSEFPVFGVTVAAVILLIWIMN